MKDKPKKSPTETAIQKRKEAIKEVKKILAEGRYAYGFVTGSNGSYKILYHQLSKKDVAVFEEYLENLKNWRC